MRLRSRMIRAEVASHSRAGHGGPHSVRGGDAPGIIDFSSNTGLLPAPRALVNAIRRSAGAVTAYPDPDSTQVRQKIAARHGLGVDNIVVGNGATEIIYEYCRAFLGPKTGVLVQAPTFSEYASAARLCGAAVVSHHVMDVSEDLSGFAGRIPRGGCVFVCNPNNPTGALLGRRDILEIAGAAARRNAQLFVDECFIELCEGGRSAIRDVRSHDNLFVLRSFTKTFGIPGVRIGYGAGDPPTASAIRQAKVPWSVSGTAHAVALAALRCDAHVKRAKKAAAAERRYLEDAINATRSFKCAMPSRANFVLVKSARLDSAQVRAKLLRKKILVRDCSSFEGLDDSFIRVAVRGRRENEALIRALESL